MSEQTELRVKVARDLSEIKAMTEMLDEQAEHKANAIVDGMGLPGGAAMISLAPVANLEAWSNRFDAATQKQQDAMVEDEDGDWEPPLQTLTFWSEDWRRENNAEWGARPTIASEVAFIRWALDWAWFNEPRFEDFAKDIRRARVRMENVLYAGHRAERTRIECDQCEAAPRLVKIYGDAEDGSTDFYKCPACRARYDDDGIRAAHAKMLRSQGAEKWMRQLDAIGSLKMQERSERTVRKWLADGEGSAWCDPVTHEVWVWWPDLWRKHLVTATRKRSA